MASVIRGDDNFDSGSAGPSTTYGDVGTYGLFLYIINGTASLNDELTVGANVTTSGSNLRGDVSGGNSYGSRNGHEQINNISWAGGGTALSGTWRCMGKNIYFTNWNRGGGNYSCVWIPLLWVRIS